jgi:WhiB family redox-sensing transcriptional regulator
MSAAPACRSVDPEVFFPPTYGATHRTQVQMAKAVCTACPVRRDCLAVAVADAELHGIWGGSTPFERAAMRGRRQMELRLVR